MSTKGFFNESMFRRQRRFEELEGRYVLSTTMPMMVVEVETSLETTNNTILESQYSQYSANDQCELETLAALINPNANVAKKYDALTGLNDVKNLYGLDGSGQTVVVIDSGIAYNHIALGGGFGDGFRVVGGYDFADHDANPNDTGSGAHGTHVAGIIASTDSKNPGVAQGVDLVALRIFSDNGTSNMQYLIDALRWVHENKDSFENPITTINLSIGYQSDALGYYTEIDKWFQILEDDGIFISVAAGNSFQTISDKTQLSYPSMSEHVVAVGSCDTSGGMSYFSQRDTGIIVAPGENIKSTVPDYRGNQNGIDDDFISLSGTSMAAPYVAGASTLIRQAMQYVGMTGITQDMIYQVMVSTADKIYDAITGQTYSRLNVKNAIESILPNDLYGDSITDASRLGTIVDTVSVEGFLNTKTDKDYFSFVASKSGTVSITAEMSNTLKGTWDVSKIPGAVVGNDGSVTFEAIAGQTYAFGFNATGSIGAYTINAKYPKSDNDKSNDPLPSDDNKDNDQTQSGSDKNNDSLPSNDNKDNDQTFPTAVTVSQATIDHQRLSEKGAWYALTSTNTGVMTVEVMLPTGVSLKDIVIETGDHDGNVAKTYAGSNRIDINVTAGTTSWVRISTSKGVVVNDASIRLTNLLCRESSQVIVSGTDGNDQFAYAAGTTQTVVINGVTYRFDSNDVKSVTFNGGQGNDTVTLTGTDGNDTLTIDGTNIQMNGASYNVSVGNVKRVVIDGLGGVDTFRYYDTAGHDEITVRTNEINIASERFLATVNGFQRLNAYSNRGGNDTAVLYDSSDNDVLNVNATYTFFNSGGTASQLYSFASVTVNSVNGGNDTATFTDTGLGDTFIGSSVSMKRSSPNNQSVEARGFTQVNLTAIYNGANSTVQLEDSRGNDTLSISTNGISLYGSNYGISVRGFDHVHTNAVNGGYDQVMFYDTSLANRLVADKNTIAMLDSLHEYWANGFDEAWAFGHYNTSSKVSQSSTDYVLNLLGLWDNL